MDYNYLDPKTNPFIYTSKLPQRFIFIVIFVFLSIVFLFFVTVLQFQKYISFKVAYLSTNFKQIRSDKKTTKYFLKKQKNTDENTLNSTNLMLLQSSTSNVKISPLLDLYLGKLDHKKIKDMYNQNNSDKLLPKKTIPQNNLTMSDKYFSKSSSDSNNIKEEDSEIRETRYIADFSSSVNDVENQISNDKMKSPESEHSTSNKGVTSDYGKNRKGSIINVITNTDSNSPESTNTNHYNLKLKNSSFFNDIKLKKKEYPANINNFPEFINSE